MAVCGKQPPAGALGPHMGAAGWRKIGGHAISRDGLHVDVDSQAGESPRVNRPSSMDRSIDSPTGGCRS